MSDPIAITTLTPEQQLNRRWRVGASEVGAMFGLDPYTTRYELWCRKSGLLPPEDLSDNDSVFWGTVLEPAVASGVALREGWKVQKVHRDSPHPKQPRLGSSLDYEIVKHPDGPGVLEIKTADRYTVKRWDNGEPPLRYQLQLQTQLACTGRDWGAIAVLVGGNDLRVHRYERHTAAIDRVLAEVTGFWTSVALKNPPAPDWQADAETIARLYSHTEPGKVVDLSKDEDFTRLCAQYDELRLHRSAEEKQQKAIKAQLTVMLGDAALALGKGCKLTARDVAGQEMKFTRQPYRDIRVTMIEAKEAV